jgi:hypothetical protein
MTPRRHLALLAVALAAAVACDDSRKPGTCDLAAQSGCDAGLRCEEVVGGLPGCFDPVFVTGRVFDLASGVGLASARVVALDVDGAPASRIGLSAAATEPVPGAYALALPVPRLAGGAPAPASFTLRADRSGYATFPGGLRTALPVSGAVAVHGTGRWTIATSQTDLGLSALPAAPAGQVAGTVSLPAAGVGVLLVAEETTSHAGLTGVPGSDGAFTIFNVPDGTYQVRAFAPGVNYGPVTVVVDAGVAAPASAALAITATPTATVGGSVQLVASTAWNQTSVLLVVASTYDPARVRGVAPPGLRASGITGTWSIAGIPDGHYRVLAAFETDYLVRDPSDIGGTAVLEFQVVNGAPRLMDGTTSAATLQGFKITGALRLTAPLRAADGSCTTVAAASLPVDPAGLLPGACTTASAAPAFGWETYAATDLYRVTVVDEQGTVTWQADVDKGSSSTSYGAAVGTAGVSATLVPPQPLVAFRTYQLKVASLKTTGGGSTLSSSEDLLGVFTYGPVVP